MDLIIQAKAAEYLFNIITGREIKDNSLVTKKAEAIKIEKGEVLQVIPEEVGISSIELNNMLIKMSKSKEANLHHIVIIKNGKTVLDTAFYPYMRDIWHVSHSACKTLISLAIGILVTRKMLTLDKKLVDIFDNECNIVSKIKLGKISVKHLLTMTSGLIANEIMIVSQKDWLKAALDSSVSFEPGSKFQYNSINTYLLSCIVEKISGKSAFMFLKENLFSILKIENIFWESCPMNRTKGGWGLYILPSDLAKIGVLMLNKGKWEGKEIVSEKYIDEMTKASVLPPKELGLNGYGYQVWIGERENSFVFNGMLGQNLHCFKEKDTVVAVTGGNKELFGRCEVNDIIDEYFGKGKIYTENKRAERTNHNKLKKTIENLTNPVFHLQTENKLIDKIPYLRNKVQSKNISRIKGKKILLASKKLSLEPFFSKLLTNNYPEGISEISFIEENKNLFMKLKEGECENIIPLNFSEFVFSDVVSGENKFKVAAKAQFTVNEDGVKVLKISMPFLEHSNGRIIKIFFEDENKVRIKMEEIPGKKVIEEGVLALGSMFPEKGGGTLMKKIDPTLVKMMASMITEPEAEGVLV